METDVNWGPQGRGTLNAAAYGLKDRNQLTPRMIKTPEGGGELYMFTYGTGCYAWNMISNELYRYTKPTDFESVVAELKKPPGKATVTVELMGRSAS